MTKCSPRCFETALGGLNHRKKYCAREPWTLLKYFQSGFRNDHFWKWNCSDSRHVFLPEATTWEDSTGDHVILCACLSTCTVLLHDHGMLYFRCRIFAGGSNVYHMSILGWGVNILVNESDKGHRNEQCERGPFNSSPYFMSTLNIPQVVW